AFMAQDVAPGTAVTLRFSVTNVDPSVTLTGVGFMDALPAGILVASPPASSTAGCGAGVVTAIAGSGSISFAGGSVAPGATCVINVNVTATTSGAKTNVTGPLTT